jgi:hypothetical protein
MKKKVFISYSVKDNRKLELLKSELQINKIDFVVVADRRNPLVSLSDKVIKGLEECEIVIPLLTSNSVFNQWVNQEIGFAKAKQKEIIPLVAADCFKDLKGFVNQQTDCPFQFKVNNSQAAENRNFKIACKELIDHLKRNSELYFKSSINKKKINQGEDYITHVSFKGKLQNGFFDNYVSHLDSNFYRWNVDLETLPKTGNNDPGLLCGNIDISKEYKHNTKDWPVGKYLIHVRLYDHLKPGFPERIIVAEEIHEIVIK